MPQSFNVAGVRFQSQSGVALFGSDLDACPQGGNVVGLSFEQPVQQRQCQCRLATDTLRHG